MNILENMSLADNKGKPYGMKFAIDKKRINYYKEELKKLNLGLEDKIYNKVRHRKELFWRCQILY